VGENAQGKTNLLESLFLLATGHSHRSDTDREMIGWSAARDPIPYARVAARVVSATRGPTDIEVVMQIARRGGAGGELPPPWSSEEAPGPSSLAGGALQKAFKVNGVRQRTNAPPGVLAVVLAGPEEVDLIGGPPAQRRRFLDLANAQTDAVYLQALQRYQRVLTQRNALLRHVRERGGSGRPAETPVWDEELARAGAYILAKRQEMLATLHAETVSAHESLTGRAEPLSLDYRSTIGPDASQSREEAKRRFLGALESSWPRDVATGVTSTGPHRDDLRLLSGDVDLGVYGSRGQQRTAALALILAQAAFMRRALGEEPVLLLDDPLSELDAARRARLLEHCLAPGRQVLLTTAEPDLIPAAVHARSTVLHVEAGAVRA
jgi:DNA replication and repair protein RecF